jgi:ubiquinone/menaquinone biosynthesis C-methylase UbiE
MGLYSRWIFPRFLDLMMQQKELVPYRERIGKAASGRVLDVGVGSGLSLGFYGLQAEYVYGVDPSAELLHFAERRAHEASIPIKLLRGSADGLPLEDSNVDTVVMTFTLCTVRDPMKAIGEMRRVLKPGGALLFAEHGRAPDPGVARWQDRLTPLWSAVAGGCHLNRKPDDLLRLAGFKIDALETRYLKGLRAMSFVYSGRAYAT